MTSGSLVRVLLARWYVSVAGLLLSLALAAVAYNLVPPQYTSSGTAVLVQPKQPGFTAAITNPLLKFDPSLNTAASIVVQGLNAPQVPRELGLTADRDTFTVKQGGSTAVSDGSGEPFISVTAQSTDPDRTTAIVALVLDRGRRDLIDRQHSMQVAARNSIRLERVVDAALPKLVRTPQLKVLGVAILIGMGITIGAAYTCDRASSRRTTRRSSSKADVHALGNAEQATEQEMDASLPLTITRKTAQPVGALVPATDVSESASVNCSESRSTGARRHDPQA